MAPNIRYDGVEPMGLDLLKIPEVAFRLGIRRRSVYDLIRSGRLESVKVGGPLRISHEALLRFLESLYCGGFYVVGLHLFKVEEH